MNITYTLKDVPAIAKSILQKAGHKTLLFYGEMGLGKTTLIKEIAKQLGVEEIANSPTFSLVNEYQTNTRETVYHFDFYRIEDEYEALDIGVEDYFDSGHWIFIEWPDKIKELLPLNAEISYIKLNKNGSRSLILEENKAINEKII